METRPLSLDEITKTGFTHVITIERDDLPDSGSDPFTLPIYPQTGTFPQGTAVWNAALTTDFFEVGGSTLTMEVGDGVDPNRYIDAADLSSGGAPALYSRLTTYPYAYTSADTVDAVFAVTDWAEITSGSVNIFLKITNVGTSVQTG